MRGASCRRGARRRERGSRHRSPPRRRAPARHGAVSRHRRPPRPAAPRPCAPAGERTLRRLGKHLVGIEPRADLVGEPEPVEAARREHASGPVRAACAAASRRCRASVRLASDGSSARSCAFRRWEADPIPIPGRIGGCADERVARVVALEAGADGEPFRIGGRHVLGGVDGHVDAPGQKRLLDLLDEDPSCADLAERTFRSISPAVVIGTKASSTPRRRSRAAACSAWAIASLEPRDPMRTSTGDPRKPVLGPNVRVARTRPGLCRHGRKYR